MLKAFKRAFGRITPAQAAATELNEAELKLLEAQTGREYADAMVQFEQRRVSRLRAHLATLQPAANDAHLTHNQRAVA